MVCIVVYTYGIYCCEYCCIVYEREREGGEGEEEVIRPKLKRDKLSPTLALLLSSRNTLHPQKNTRHTHTW